MTTTNHDCIHIRDLDVECIVGVLPEERTTPRVIRINLRCECSLAKAGRSDSLEDTVDYRDLHDRIITTVQASQDLLIERLAQRVADVALAVPGIECVNVVLDKPGALPQARSVAVEISRTRVGQLG
jgi:FolB domain-containing protein